MLARALAIVALVAAGSAAWAMDSNDVTNLAKARVGDDVIVAQIKATKARFVLTADDIIRLKKDGVSDAVLKAMIETVKPEPKKEPAANADSAGGAQRPAGQPDKYPIRISSKTAEDGQPAAQQPAPAPAPVQVVEPQPPAPQVIYYTAPAPPTVYYAPQPDATVYYDGPGYYGYPYAGYYGWPWLVGGVSFRFGGGWHGHGHWHGRR
jgi:hypothetical protein